MKPGPALKLREASFNDHEQIAALESRYGLGSKDYDEWSHLWLANPLYRELQGGWTLGWVLEDAQHRIVGSMGNIPLLYEFEGKRILAASGRHWVAEPAYRSFSLALLERVVNQRHVDLYLNNTVTAQAAASFSTFECPRAPVGVWDESAFWITNYRGFMESFLVLKNFALAKTLSYPLSAAVFLKDLLAKKALPAGDVQVEVCSRFDERFDEFWVELKRNNPHLLLAVRTREALEWHYKYSLLSGRLWILTAVDGSRLLAYVTFERRDKPELGLKRVSLVDFQSLDGSITLLSPLLSFAVKKCRDDGIHALENIGRWLERGELIETLAPYRRKLPTWSFFYRANNPELAERLRDRRAWAPSLFDGDASLCSGFVDDGLSKGRPDNDLPAMP
ncbi:MAG: hypothetical protein C5B58_13805 [Acidobacteria bacterium]|nr:MAG: hypothetical protein C5B58_13805 [Acidobacteriota bacterium]